MHILLLAVVNLGFLFGTHVLLSCGEAAQRTHTYSILRELEIKGAITNTAQLTTASPGNLLLKMNPMKEFHYAVLGSCFVWAVFVTALFIVDKSSHAGDGARSNP